MRRTTRLVRTPARPDSSADPTGPRPKPRGSRSARAILHTGWLRAGRVLANWKLSGDYRLVWEAVSHRCQEPLREFLEAGGRVSASEVEYRGLRLERRPFTGRDLAGVAYVKRFVDYGGTISKLDGRFVAILPNGLHDTYKMKIATGAYWPYLADEDLDVQRAFGIWAVISRSSSCVGLWATLLAVTISSATFATESLRGVAGK